MPHDTPPPANDWPVILIIVVICVVLVVLLSAVAP